MKREEVKKAVEQAEEELKNKQIEEVKKLAKATLEKIANKEVKKSKKKEEITTLEKEIKILKNDIEDLKNGRLDLIAERQKKNPEAKEISVAIIEKKVVEEHHHHHYNDRWYNPYIVRWIEPSYVPALPQIWCTTADTNAYDCDSTNITTNNATLTIDNSTAAYATIGTYNLSNGSVKEIRKNK